MHKIVIIGAGLAGLGAALTLHKHPSTPEFIILEAQDHAGGRVKSMHIPSSCENSKNSIIELGAQWVHGIDNDLFNILVEHDLVHEQTSDEALGIYIRDDGVILDEFLVKRVDFQVGRILEKCEDFIDEDNFPPSVGHFLNEKFNEWIAAEENYTEEEVTMMHELFDWHVRFQLIDNSCGDLNKLSAKEWGRYSCLGKDGQKHINVKGGYSSLINAILSKLPSNAIHYNNPAESIQLVSEDNNLQKINSNGNVQEDYPILIVLKGGNVVRCQYAIVTCSLGVLQSVISLPMEEETNTTIQKMGYGGMGKVFLEFEHRWWTHDGFQLIWRRRRLREGCDHFPAWVHHLSGFDCVLDQPRMLLGWVSDLGIDEFEAASQKSIGRDCTLLLRHFLKDSTVPFPVRVFRTSWSRNPWIRGGYSHTTAACDTGPLPTASVLRKPFRDNGNVPRVWLAGEAVHEAHFSTTHGAFESGQMQAHALIDNLM